MERPVFNTAFQDQFRKIFLKIGAEPGLEALLQEFYARMANDVLIGFFFTGKNVPAIASKQKEFLMKAMGVAPSYEGKAPAQAHTKLAPILKGHFDRRLQILEDLLKEKGLPEADWKAWIAFENAFRNGIQAN
jgi:hemoglobin